MTRETAREELRWKHRPFPELVRLAWPIAVSMLSYSVMTVVDTLFVGRLGASALAAVGLGGIASFTLLCFGFSVFRGGKTLVAQAVGAGQPSRARAFLGAFLCLAVAMGLAMALIGQVVAAAMPALTVDEDTGRLSGAYLAIRIAGAPFALIAAALREARYGTGDTRAPMRAAVFANLANIPLNALLIFGLGLGVQGAAWATVLAYVFDVAWLALAQRGDGFGLDSFDRADLLAVWRIGLPVGIERVLDVGSFTVLVSLLARMSAEDLAAHQIAIQVCHFSFLPAFAIGEAASILVGRAVGAGEDHRVRRIAVDGVYLALIYMAFWSAVEILAAPWLGRLFTQDPAVLVVSTRLLYIATAFQIFDAVYSVGRGVLRGSGDVRFVAVTAVTVAWCFTPTLAGYLGVVRGYGAVGGWLGLCAEIFVGGAILWTRLLRGGWRKAAELSRQRMQAEREQAQRTVLVPAG